MRKKFKNVARVIVVFMILATSTNCQKEDDVGQTKDSTLLSAREWFKDYETKSGNYVLFQNLDYNWNNSQITNSEDGTKTIIVPINEIKRDASEIWEQKLYIYKFAENKYEALLFEIYPDNKDTDNSLIENGTFNGYISAWDLKKGFVKTAKFRNGKLVENGSINVLSKNKGMTSKMPSNQTPCPAGVECDTDGGGTTDTGTQLKEVVVQNNYQDSSGYIIIYNTGDGGYTSGTGTEGYTNHGTGTGTGGEGGDNGDAANPCDKIKAQMAIANIKAKIDELKKKTNLKTETGYSQSKNGPFTALTIGAGTANTDSVNLAPDTNTVGYIHTHLDPYDKAMPNGVIEPVEPIRMFSPGDVKQFLILILNAQKNKIPISSIYGTVVTSSGTYQLRFTGNVTDVSVKGGSINWGVNLDIFYKEIMKKNSLENGFLKFLNEKIGINGIELYKIEAKGNFRKALDTKGQVIVINCN